MNRELRKGRLIKFVIKVKQLAKPTCETAKHEIRRNRAQMAASLAQTARHQRQEVPLPPAPQTTPEASPRHGAADASTPHDACRRATIAGGCSTDITFDQSIEPGRALI